MSAPRFVQCKCGHGKPDHERDGFAPQCTANACTCLRYVPGTAPERLAAVPGASAIRPAIAPATTAAPPVGVHEQILARGARSESKRIVQLTEKIEDLLIDLRARLMAERKAGEEKRRKAEQAERVKAEIAALEAELAAKKAALRGSGPVREASKASKPTQECPTCGKPCVNLGVHRAKAHGWRKAAS